MKLRCLLVLGLLVVAGCESKKKEPAPEPVKKAAEVEPAKKPLIEDMALGSEHLCVLADGEVWCAGDQTDPTASKLAAATEWRLVETPDKVTSISSSNLRTCAVTEAGKLACWGGYNNLPRRIEAVENVEDVLVYGAWQLVNRQGGIISYDNAFAIHRDGGVTRVIGESGEPRKLDVENVEEWVSVDYVCDDCEKFGYWAARHESGAVEWGEIRSGDEKYPSLGNLFEAASDIAMAHLGDPWGLAVLAVVDGKLRARTTQKEERKIDGPDSVKSVEGLCALSSEDHVWCFLEKDGPILKFTMPFGERKTSSFVAEKKRVCAIFDEIECRDRATIVGENGDAVQYVKVTEPIPLKFEKPTPAGRSSDAN